VRVSAHPYARNLVALSAPARIDRRVRELAARPPGWLRTPTPWLLLLAAAALLVRAPLFTVRSEVTPGGDSEGYVVAARAIGSLSFPGMARMPGYPFFIWVCSLLPGRTEDAVVITQHLLGIALVLGITGVGWRLFSPPAGVIAGTLAAISPVYVALEDHLLADFLFGAVLFAGAASLATVCARGVDGRGRLIVIGALFALATYIKPVGQGLVFAAPIAFALTSRDSRRAIRGAAIVAATMIVLLAPWAVRNAIVNHDFGLTNQLGVTLYNRAFEIEHLPVPIDGPHGPLVRQLNGVADKDPALRPSSYVRAELIRHGFSYGEAVEIQRTLAVTAIRRAPATYLKTSIKRVGTSIAEIHTPAASPARLGNASAAVRRPAVGLMRVGWRLSDLWWVLTASAFSSLILILVPGPPRAAAVALATAPLLVLIVTVLTHGGSYRYSAQAAPELWLLASAGLAFVLRALIREVARARASG
jgi:hypothetical protein